MNKTIGIIGFGNMGQAIAQQLKNDYQIYCFDKDKSKTSSLSGIQATSNVPELLDKTEIIILSIKPQDLDALLKEIKPYPHLADKVFISIAAGISTFYIEKNLGIVRVIRAMPNIALTVGESMTCLCKGKFATGEDFDAAEDLFEFAGEILGLDEAMINAATAISGSGPAWYFERVNLNYERWQNNRAAFIKEFIIDLKEAAIKLGFNPFQAGFLSSTTAHASDLMLTKLNKKAIELRDQVASKGGTTEAGLKVLHSGGSLIEAIKAAQKRAEELSRGE